MLYTCNLGLYTVLILSAGDASFQLTTVAIYNKVFMHVMRKTAFDNICIGSPRKCICFVLYRTGKFVFESHMSPCDVNDVFGHVTENLTCDWLQL